jgi:hypothetical protein
LKWSFDSLLAYGTTDKRPASHLESRPDDIGYNDLEACRYRRLVLAVLLRLNSYLTPFQRGQAFSSELRYSIFKVLKNMFSASLSNN